MGETQRFVVLAELLHLLCAGVWLHTLPGREERPEEPCLRSDRPCCVFHWCWWRVSRKKAESREREVVGASGIISHRARARRLVSLRRGDGNSTASWCKPSSQKNKHVQPSPISITFFWSLANGPILPYHALAIGLV